ncbi:hypothetical protein [Acinetobacter oleivorans]|uniref:hypothetical protein n=1 Tax=Acinetobacter oleivorans TaxID=1148157 RepID=UPI003A83D557
MSLEIPLDRLDKFLAIGGLALIFWAINISLSNYERTEIYRIKALVKVQETNFKYNNYSDTVNKSINIHNNAIKNKKDLSKYKNEILINLKEAEKKGIETEKVILENLEATYTLVLYERIKLFWLIITAVLTIIGIIVSIIGFKSWVKNPN